MGICHLAHMLSVPPAKACLLCATPVGMDLYRQAMPVGTYRVQSPGFPKIVYCMPLSVPEMIPDFMPVCLPVFVCLCLSQGKNF